MFLQDESTPLPRQARLTRSLPVARFDTVSPLLKSPERYQLAQAVDMPLHTPPSSATSLPPQTPDLLLCINECYQVQINQFIKLCVAGRWQPYLNCLSYSHLIDLQMQLSSCPIMLRAALSLPEEQLPGWAAELHPLSPELKPPSQEFHLCSPGFQSFLSFSLTFINPIHSIS